jgi:ferrochelatase
MLSQTVGVLVMSYGTPEIMDQVEAYYTHIRRGRPPSPEQLKELMDRYQAIGGIFPLRQNTNDQVRALQLFLDEQASKTGIHFRCFQGLKHASPLIEQGVQEMADAGITDAVGIVLAPHYSLMSVGEYIVRAEKEAKEKGLRLTNVKSYHLHPLFIEAWSERIIDTLNQFEAKVRSKVHILFTAHSLPEKILKMNDPYPDQLLATSQAIMDRLKLENRWQLAWQSKGQTNEPWLGPDLLEVLESLKKNGVDHVLACPVGFVSDHLETLYDIDIEAQRAAQALGIDLKRTTALNSDPRYISVLGDMVIQAYKGVFQHDRP